MLLIIIALKALIIKKTKMIMKTENPVSKISKIFKKKINSKVILK